MSRSISLQTKLVGAFSIVAVILSIVGWVGYSSSRNFQVAANDMNEKQIPQMSSLSEVAYNTVSIRMLCNSLLNPGYPAKSKKEYALRQAEYLKEMESAWNKYDKTKRNAEEEARWQELGRLFEGVKKGLNVFNATAQTDVGARTPEEAASASEEAAGQAETLKNLVRDLAILIHGAQ